MDMLIEGYTFWKALQEAQHSDSLVMTFGRFNPPTIGHKWLFQQMLNIATRERAEAFVFTSHSQDKKKNPLSYVEKCELVSKLLPRGVRLVRTNARNMIEIVKEIAGYNRFRKLIVVVGDDRLESFSWIDKSKEEFGFTKVELKSAGARSGASNVQNASATALRNAAKAGDMEAFMNYSPFDAKTSEKVFNIIKDRLK